MLHYQQFLTFLCQFCYSLYSLPVLKFAVSSATATTA